MQAVILAGGFGTRLSEKTDVIPKPMIQIGEYPILWHIMKHLSGFEVKNFLIALGYKGEIIKEYFLDYHNLHSDLKVDLSSGHTQVKKKPTEDWNISLVDTGLDAMTGGRLRRLKDKITDTFLFTYGDGLANVDIAQLLNFHKSHGKLATVTAVAPKQRFGVIVSDEQNRVMQFAEKPEESDQLINGGFFMLEPEAIDFIDADHISWEKEPCERLAAKGELMAYHHAGYWQCVDTLHELRLLRELWNKGQAQWKTWE